MNLASRDGGQESHLVAVAQRTVRSGLLIADEDEDAGANAPRAVEEGRLQGRVSLDQQGDEPGHHAGAGNVDALDGLAGQAAQLRQVADSDVHWPSWVGLG